MRRSSLSRTAASSPTTSCLLSFTGTVDGEPYEGNEVDKYLYEMSRGLMPAEFDTGIVGAKPGEERHVEFEIPETSSNAEFVGKTAGFEVTIHEVKAKVLPEIDEEFATNVGGFDSVEDMLADLKSRIDLQKGSQIGRLREERTRAILAERLEGEIPETMITSRQSTMMRDFLAMLESREMPIDQYLASSGIDMDTLEADLNKQAIQSVREELALEALFRERGMEVTDEDIDAELKEIASSTETSPEDARKRWEELGLMAVVREQIMHRKAILWLLDNITVVEQPQDRLAVHDLLAHDRHQAELLPALARVVRGGLGGRSDLLELRVDVFVGDFHTTLAEERLERQLLAHRLNCLLVEVGLERVHVDARGGQVLVDRHLATLEHREEVAHHGALARGHRSSRGSPLRVALRGSRGCAPP